jgi:hypothetical protein
VSRSGTLSVPDRVQRAFVAGVAALLTFPFVVGGVGLAFEALGMSTGGQTTLVVAGGVSFLGAALLFGLASRESDDDSVWNAIPSRQYEGRHAESGGIARGEQERALEDVQEREE